MFGGHPGQGRVTGRTLDAIPENPGSWGNVWESSRQILNGGETIGSDPRTSGVAGKRLGGSAVNWVVTCCTKEQSLCRTRLNAKGEVLLSPGQSPGETRQRQRPHHGVRVLKGRPSTPRTDGGEGGEASRIAPSGLLEDRGLLPQKPRALPWAEEDCAFGTQLRWIDRDALVNLNLHFVAFATNTTFEESFYFVNELPHIWM